MSNKWRTKLRWSARENKDLNRELARDKAADELAYGVTAKLFDLNDEEVRGYFELVGSEPDLELVLALEKSLKGVNSNYARTLHGLENVIKQYESWMTKVANSSIIKSVIEKDVDYDAVKEAMIEAGSKKQVMFEENDHLQFISQSVENPDEISLWELEGGYFLESQLLDKRHTLSDIVSIIDLASLRELKMNLFDFFKRTNESVTKLYIDDFITLVPKMPSSSGMDIGVIDYSMVTSYLRFHADDALEGLRKISKYIPYYEKLIEKSAFKLYQLFAQTNINRFEMLKFVADSVDEFPIEGGIRRNLVDIVEASKDRVAVFDLMRELPRSVHLFKYLSKAQIRKDEYAKFLLNYGYAKLSGNANPMNMLDVLEVLCVEPYQVQSAAILVRNAGEFIVDSNANRIVNLAQQYTDAHVLISDYFKAVESNRLKRGELLLRIGECKPDSKKLKELRQRIGSIGEQELDWISENLGIDQIYSKLKGTSFREKEVIQVAKKSIHWFDAMKQSMQRNGISGEEILRIDQAYTTLPVDLTYRIREIYYSMPESLLPFCDEVNQIANKDVFYLVLGSPLLFDAYKSKLGLGGISKEIFNISASGVGNPYRKLCDLLLLTDEFTPVEPEEVPEASNEIIARKKYDRIIVWGGQYSTQAKQKINGSVEKELLIFDLFNKRSDVSIARPGDAVIVVTTSFRHGIYYSLKHHCEIHGIDFYHFNHAGHNPLMQMLKSLV